MQMTTTVTARDKKLLIGLAAFLLVVGVYWFVLRPLSAELTDLSDKINTETMQKNANDFQISHISGDEETLKTLVDTLTQDQTFFPMMEDHDIDELLTYMALDYGFAQEELLELTIHVPESSATVGDYLSEDAKSVTGVYEATATMKIKGTRETIQPFLDILAGDNIAIRVNSFEWADNTSDSSATITVSVSIFMTDAADAVQSGQERIAAAKP